MNDLNEIASEICNWITKDFTMSDGLLSAVYYPQKKSLDKRNLLTDLGDYIPFLTYFGYNEYCENQIKKLQLHLTEKGILEPQGKFLGMSKVSAFDHSDLILGLLEYYSLTSKKWSLKKVLEITENVLSVFYSDGFMSSTYFHNIDKTFPLANSLNGIHIELLTELYKYSRNKKYFTIAKNIANFWIKNDFFRSYGLFQNFIPKYKWLKIFPYIKRNSKTVNIMKNNTNMLFALLELYRCTNNDKIKVAIYKWFKNVKKRILNKDYMSEHIVIFDKYKKTIKNANLTSNFAIIEVLCDCTWTFEDESFLDVAKKIAQKWISIQSRSTGLFPLYPKCKYSYLDSETDMIIALMKLYELSEDEMFKISAIRTFNGILKFHRMNKGYALSVDIYNGKILDPTVKIKFVTLLLKPIILFLSGNKIYNNQQLFYLIRDR